MCFDYNRRSRSYARNAQIPAVCILGLAVLGSMAAALGQSLPSKPIDIESRLEPLFDDHLIDRMRGVELRVHQPASAGTVMRFDQPWEGAASHQITVYKDDDRYRMYYRGSSVEGLTLSGRLAPGEKVVPPHEDYTCYAESRDGITWTRPQLGLHVFAGSKANNIIWTGRGTNSFAPFKDGNPAAPATERYKAVAGTSDPGDGGRKIRTLIGFVSSDGVTYQHASGKPLLTDGMFDSLNIAYWDELNRRYVTFYRDLDLHRVRGIKRATSEDFITWSKGEFVDFGDAPHAHMYTNGITPYFRAPHLLVGLARRFMPARTHFADISHPGVSDAVLITSRDGFNWKRHEAAFIRPGLDERNWTHRANTPAHGIVPTGPNELSFYVARHYTFPSAHLERFTLRTDGFVSVHAGGAEGEFVSKPLLFSGRELVLNFSTSAMGSIRLELQDATGRSISGFSLEESPVIFGDKIAHAVSWGRRSDERYYDLSKFRGTPLRLRFVMRDADLYSIRFQ